MRGGPGEREVDPCGAAGWRPGRALSGHPQGGLRVQLPGCHSQEVGRNDHFPWGVPLEGHNLRVGGGENRDSGQRGVRTGGSSRAASLSKDRGVGLNPKSLVRC